MRLRNGMKTIFLAAVVALTLQGQDSGTTFSDTDLGIAFTHPSNWTLVKKTKDTSRFRLPVDGSTDTADLEITRAVFHRAKDMWQQLQVQANQASGRQVDRQYEQDVIGVPMLLTQSTYTDKGVSKTVLTGLYYAHAPYKMQMKLTAPSAVFDQVWQGLQSTFETLHTLSGAAPVEETDGPDVIPTKKDKKKDPPVTQPPKRTNIGSPVGEGKLFKGPVVVPVVVSTKPVNLRLPSGWTADEVKDNTVTLHNPKLSDPVQVEIRSTLDSETAASALSKRVAEGLNAFQTGAHREDGLTKANRAGCSISPVWRVGKTEKGDLMTLDLTGSQGDFYLLASYKATNEKNFKDDRVRIQELLDGISLEPGS